jgi:uncharacterized protein with PIN domain
LTALGPPDRVDSGELPREQEVVVVEQDRKREDEWFLANEKRLLETARFEREKREKERAAQTAEADRKRLRDQHFMRCPKCGHEMKEEELTGVKIDRCSFCEGIFFDAGELDQVLLKREDDRRGFFRKLVKI